MLNKYIDEEGEEEEEQELSNANKNNKLMLYQTNSDLTQTNLFTGIGVTTGNMRFQVPSNTTDYIFYSAIGTSETSSNEVFRIKGTNEIQIIGNQQKYSIKAGGYTVNDISFQSQKIYNLYFFKYKNFYL